ncbi:MAG: ATP-binding cassette domain-containing protein [Mycobacterium sp.]|nr:ATP-binding cassette domain-containing protein [Mycobacterium sp.]
MVDVGAAAPLTVRMGSAIHTFPAGREVLVGRNPACDIRIDAAQDLISRTHLVLHTEGADWVAEDRSSNGIFVDGNRVSRVPITDDVAIALGAPDGPRLTFQLSTTIIRLADVHALGRAQTGPGPAPVGPPPQPPAPPRPAPMAPRPMPPQPGVPIGPGDMRTPVPVDNDTVSRMTNVVKRVLPQRPAGPPPGAVVIGRGEDSGVVVSDALASRLHAFLVRTPAGVEIRDNSSNGTFVNGARIMTALLTPGDVVTIGNTDLTFNGTTLVPREAAPHTAGVAAYRVGLTVEDDKALLQDVSFQARPGTLTAVIGPSGAGKSTLIRVLGGGDHPTTGWVSFDGHDVHAEYASLRSRIGVVPQDDVVHRQLTVQRALQYAAELRLPPDTSRDDRDRVIADVLAELELTEHRDTRIDKLSGGQRKRVSVAMELLTGPSLLILDEPTSGLDPALDRHVMAMLRRLADAGRVVVVVTHSLTYLNVCDQVLLLAPGGKTAYAGAPGAVAAAIGTSDWADIFAWISTDPDGAHSAFLARSGYTTPPEPALAGGPTGSPAATSLRRQLSTVARRQFRLMLADRAYFVFLALLPFVLGSLALVVPGHTGLGRASSSSSSPQQAAQLLILLNIAVVFMGTALTIRDLVGERAIFRREQAVGLSASAYLAAKFVVYALAAAIQTAVLLVIVVAGQGGPTQGAVLLGSPALELYVALTATAIASAVLGLLLSSLARSTEQILPMLVVTIMLSIVFAGGMIPVTGRIGLTQLSWLLPARWGYAATASTIDLLKASPLETNKDQLWFHEARWWLLDMAALVVLTLAYGAALRWRLRLPRLRATVARPVPGAAAPGAPTDTGPRPAAVAGKERSTARWAAIIGIVAVIAVVLTGLSVITRDSGTRKVNVGSSWDSDDDKPAKQPVEPDQLAQLLMSPSRVSSEMSSAPMGKATPVAFDKPRTTTVTPPDCTSVVEVGSAAVYTADSGFTAMAGQVVVDPTEPNRVVEQALVAFPDADAAATFEDDMVHAWRRCETATVVGADGAQIPVNIGGYDSVDGRTTIQLSMPGRICQRAVQAVVNVVIDVRSCAPGPGKQAAEIVKVISNNIR